MRLQILALLVLSHGQQALAWTCPLGTGRSRSGITRMYSADTQREKTLREEIAERNTAVEDEGKYAVADGELLEKLDNKDEAKEAAAEVTSEQSPLQAKMARMTKPRAYPLFLAEKAAEFLEGTFEDITDAFGLSESPPANENGVKERIVILGTGWGGASFLKAIDSDLYDVTIISPRNHFVFTPLLAGASVGTVEFRSICEPIREINRKANFLEATATEIDTKEGIVLCESVSCEGNSCEIDSFEVKYDRLVVSVGAQTNTFGIPGVRERCNFLKNVEDARRIRTAMVNCFERASLPSMTEEDRERNLTFAVIGAGPTGIEFAAELRDFVEEDGAKYYPHLLKYVRIKVIEASDKVLAPFDKSLQTEAVRQLQRKVIIRDPEVQALLPESFKLTELLLDSSVKEVGENKISLGDGSEIPYGLAVWAAGNGPIPLTLQLIEALGEEQAKEQEVARGRLAIDPWMRVIGSEGRILAFGDCTCVSQGQLPATAQVAQQQAEYLASLLNRKYEISPARVDNIFPPPVKDEERTEPSVSDFIAGFAINSNEYAKPFQFLNLGILAYTGGGSALAQVSTTPDAEPFKGSGKIGNAVWRSVYLSKQVSWRNRLLVLNDWTKRRFFGRDVTRL